MRDRNRPAQPLGEALDAYLQRAQLTRRLAQASVIPEWERLVGRRIAEVTTPTSVTENGVLIVAVRSAAWAQELQLMTPEILRQLGAAGKRIRRILWRTA